MPKISVIIPVYNIAKYLKKCLDSVINQTFSDIDIICINDGSTDNSLAILEQYASKDNRITIINKPNGGLSSAWNAGLQAVKSPYLTFVDGDDWIEKNTLELAYKAITNNDVDYVCWGANIVSKTYDKNTKNQKNYHKIKYSGIKEVDDNLIRKTVVTVWSKLYKTSIIKEKGISFPTSSGHDDNAFWLMYAPWTKKGYYIPEYLYNYVQRENSIMWKRRLKNTDKIFDNIILIPPLINYYKNHNLTDIHYELLILNIKKLFLNDFRFLDGRCKHEVLEKCSNDLKNINLQELYKSEFIKAIIRQDIKYIEKTYSYTLFEKLFSFKDLAEYIVICILGLKIKIKYNRKIYFCNISKKERLLNMEIKEVMESGLWDAEYYMRKNPDLNLKKLSAVKHYLTKGWKYGLNPSAVFDGENYIKRYPKIKYNPLLYFLYEGRYEYKDAFLYNKFKYEETSLNAYTEYKKSRKSNKVVYTCITGNYDDLEEIKGYIYINFDWDYVCFTDNQNLINQKQFGIWEIRPLQFTELDDTRNNRWHKINSHLILSEYGESIYIDANINILTNKLFEILNNNNKDIILASHANTICLYKEFEWVLRAKIDKPEIMQAHLKLLQDSGFPKNYGMPENNLIYRQHNKPKVISLMEDWWYMVENYTKRDQLSLPYVLWKHNINCNDVIAFPNTRIDYKNFCTFVHKGKRLF